MRALLVPRDSDREEGEDLMANPYQRYPRIFGSSQPASNPREAAKADAPGLTAQHLDDLVRGAYVDGLFQRHEITQEQQAAAWDEGAQAGQAAALEEAKNYVRVNILPHHRLEDILNLIATLRDRTKTKRDREALQRLNNLVSRIADGMDSWAT
jgi:hypothetical protein